MRRAALCLSLGPRHGQGPSHGARRCGTAAAALRREHIRAHALSRGQSEGRRLGRPGRPCVTRRCVSNHAYAKTLRAAGSGTPDRRSRRAVTAPEIMLGGCAFGAWTVERDRNKDRPWIEATLPISNAIDGAMIAPRRSKPSAGRAPKVSPPRHDRSEAPIIRPAAPPRPVCRHNDPAHTSPAGSGCGYNRGCERVPAATGSRGERPRRESA